MSSDNQRPKIGRRVWIWRRYRRPVSLGKTGYWEQGTVENAGNTVSGVRSRYGYLLQVPNNEIHDKPSD